MRERRECLVCIKKVRCYHSKICGRVNQPLDTEGKKNRLGMGDGQQGFLQIEAYLANGTRGHPDETSALPVTSRRETSGVEYGRF